MYRRCLELCLAQRKRVAPGATTTPPRLLGRAAPRLGVTGAFAGAARLSPQPWSLSWVFRASTSFSPWRPSLRLVGAPLVGSLDSEGWDSGAGALLWPQPLALAALMSQGSLGVSRGTHGASDGNRTRWRRPPHPVSEMPVKHRVSCQKQ